MISHRESNFLSYMKAFAVFSIVCAHISLVPDDFSIQTKFLCELVNEIGGIGVGVFFIISGYLFKRKAYEPYKVGEFFRKKIQAIVIPWFFAASLVYIYVAVRKGGSLIEGILSVAGYKSSYWYMAVLMILYLLFMGVIHSKHEQLWIGVCFLLSGISVLLRYFSIIQQDIFGVYLNIFNWTIFFALGYLCAMNRNVLVKIFSNKGILGASGISSAIFLLIPVSYDIGFFSYFSFWYIPAELVISLFLACICYCLSDRELKMLRYVGDMSFSIYLYHELVWAGLIVYIFNKIDSILLVLIRPVVVVILVLTELRIGELVFKALKKEILYYRFIGARFK